MQVPLSWLKEYVDLTLPTAALAERLTLAGLEVSGVEMVGDWWDPETIVVGRVTAVLPHPDADRLVLVDVDYGGPEPQRVVTGAPNLFEYKGADTLPVLKVAFAREGAFLIDAYSDEQPRPKKKLKASKIRGVRSAGMVCSERELGLSEEHEGIMLLPADAPVGTPLRDYLGEEVIELDLTPDMARCLSLTGVAREVAALTGAPLHLPADEWSPAGDDQVDEYAKVQIDEPELCNRYTGILIRDVTIGESPRWMQQALLNAGMRPINNIVDITNFVMLEYGQPLHAFDYDILLRRAQSVGDEIPTIIVKRAGDGERFTTLDDVTRTLDDSMLMIADTAGSVAIAGVMGGQESEVGPETRNILLESATFEGINNRRTAQALRLPSEASFRFARGVPSTLNPLAARRAAELMRRYAGGRIVPGIADAYPVKQETPLVYTTISDMHRILGMPITHQQVVESLERLDFQVRTVDAPADGVADSATFALHRLPGETLYECRPPWHRLDINIPADLVEEVARVVGYEHVGTTLMDEELPMGRHNDLLETEDLARSVLVACGLQETINHTLSSPENHDKLRPDRRTLTTDDDYVTLTNPIAPEKRSMRQTLLVSALENLARNLRYSRRLATFEVGRVYLPSQEPEQVLPTEERRISLLMAGPRREGQFYTGDEEEMDFFDLKGVVERLLDRLGHKAEDVEYRANPDSGTFGPRCAEVWLNGVRLGLMGEIHPQVRAAYGLPNMRVNAAELAVAPMVRPHWRLEPMPPISNYPPVVEDLAFAVAEEITARQVDQLIHQAGGDLVTDVAIFDIYRGDQIGAGNKSLAFQVTYQAPDRSLSDKEVARVRKRIIQTVERETGGSLRQ